MKKTRVLAICPNPADATSLYRAAGPLSNLYKHGHIELHLSPVLHYTDFVKADVVFIQRPSTAGFAEYCEFVKNHNKPLWIDFDDDLLAVPEDNPAYEIYGNKAIQSNIKACLKLADVISVSTEALKVKFSQFSSNIQVIPNALDLETIPQYGPDWEARTPVVMWRGGTTHERDVFTVHRELLKLGLANSMWKFVFLGHDFKWLKWQMNEGQYKHVKNLDHAIFMHTLKEIGAPIHIVPLEDNEFNRSKSNIAWLEATWAGSAVVAPYMPEWAMPGVATYSTAKGFEDTVQLLMLEPDTMKEMQERSWMHILDNYTLEKVNLLRLALLAKLTIR